MGFLDRFRKREEEPKDNESGDSLYEKATGAKKKSDSIYEKATGAKKVSVANVDTKRPAVKHGSNWDMLKSNFSKMGDDFNKYGNMYNPDNFSQSPASTKSSKSSNPSSFNANDLLGGTYDMLGSSQPRNNQPKKPKQKHSNTVIVKIQTETAHKKKKKR